MQKNSETETHGTALKPRELGHSNRLVGGGNKVPGTLLESENTMNLKLIPSIHVSLSTLGWSALASLWGGLCLLAESEPILIHGHKAHPTRLMAQFKRPGQGLMSGAARLAASVEHRFSLVPGMVVLDTQGGRAGLLSATNPPDAAQQLLDRIEALKATGLFESVEPDYVVNLAALPTDSAFTEGKLWALWNVGQEGGVPGADISVVPAWDLTTGSSDVIVAVLDTGIRYTHQDLAAQIWRNPGESGGGKETNGIDDDGDGYVDNVFGIDAISGSGDPMDQNGHGTHVASTIGAAANDGHPHVGVTWNVRLMACKFSTESQGFISDAIEGIDFAVAKGAKVLNASWGSEAFHAGLSNAVARAGDLGVLVVAAAGNRLLQPGSNIDLTPVYPAGLNLPNVIAVTASDRHDRLCRWANYGLRTVHLAAPGAEIYSCGGDADDAYALEDGTSMAAPHVSGAAALVWGQYPGASVTEVRQRLLVGATHLRQHQGLTRTGGRLNVLEALSVQADNALEIGLRPLEGTPLPLGGSVDFVVRVSDLYEVTDALVQLAIPGWANEVLLDDGQGPDVAAADAEYSTRLALPSDRTQVEVTLTVESPGRQPHTRSYFFPLTAPPLNDAYAGRTPIAGYGDEILGSNVTASAESFEFDWSQVSPASVWWSWTAPENGDVTITTEGSDFDTVLEVCDDPENSTAPGHRVTDNDQAPCGGDFSEATFHATAGSVYAIVVSGFRGATGTIRMRVLRGSRAPVNDDFADRIRLAGTALTVEGCNGYATREPGEPNLDTGEHSVWWSWVAPANGMLRIDVLGNLVNPDGGSFNKVLALYTGATLETLQLVQRSYNGPTPRVELPVTQGQEYHIYLVDVFAHEVGPLKFVLSWTPAPGNDDFENRSTLAGTQVTASGSNWGAGRQAGEAVLHASAAGHSAWWRWVAPANGYAVFEAMSDQFIPVVAAYTGATLDTLAQVAVAADWSPTNRIGWPALAGTEYQIALDGRGVSGMGEANLSLRFFFPPSNDAFANRSVLTGSLASTVGYNYGATREADEPVHHAHADSEFSVWWTWTAPAEGRVTLAVMSDFQCTVAVYKNDNMPTLEKVANTTTLVPDQYLSFEASAGTAYQIAVAGNRYYDGVGQFTLALGLAGPARFETVSVNPLGEAELSFSGAPATVYWLEGSSNLTHWDPITRLTNQIGQVRFVDRDAPRFNQRFYRLVAP